MLHTTTTTTRIIHIIAVPLAWHGCRVWWRVLYIHIIRVYKFQNQSSQYHIAPRHEHGGRAAQAANAPFALGLLPLRHEYRVRLNLSWEDHHKQVCRHGASPLPASSPPQLRASSPSSPSRKIHGAEKNSAAGASAAMAGGGGLRESRQARLRKQRAACLSLPPGQRVSLPPCPSICLPVLCLLCRHSS